MCIRDSFPDAFIEVLSGKDLTAVAREQQQNAILQIGKLDFRAVLDDFIIVGADQKAGQFDHLSAGYRLLTAIDAVAPQHRLDTGGQFRIGKRLDT